jgi:hypothetical protein
MAVDNAALSTVGGVLSVIVGLHIVFGAFWLLSYADWVQRADNRPPFWYVLGTIALFALPALLHTDDDDKNLLYRRWQKKADDARSNAGVIKTERELLMSLLKQPQTADIRRQVADSRDRLERLRKYDEEVEATAALQVLDSSIAACKAAITATNNAQADVRSLPSS